MINKILKELDHMIKFQEKEIELDMQAEELEGKIHFETAKLLAYDEVARMIKKMCPGSGNFRRHRCKYTRKV